MEPKPALFHLDFFLLIKWHRTGQVQQTQSETLHITKIPISELYVGYVKYTHFKLIPP